MPDRPRDMHPQTAKVQGPNGQAIPVVLPMVIRFRGRLYQLMVTKRGNLHFGLVQEGGRVQDEENTCVDQVSGPMLRPADGRSDLTEGTTPVDSVARGSSRFVTVGGLASGHLHSREERTMANGTERLEEQQPLREVPRVPMHCGVTMQKFANPGVGGRTITEVWVCRKGCGHQERTTREIE